MRTIALFGLALAIAGTSLAQGRFEVDSVVLKDGTKINGLIINNTVDAVTIQTRHTEKTYPKSEIVRIQDTDEISTESTSIHKAGTLPPWRVLVNDLRTHDGIKSMVEIPAVRIDEGVFRNVPYRSFRMNRLVELNIYGDPENPAAIELGLFGRLRNNEDMRKVLRSYLAGYLTSRKEIGEFYKLGLEQGKVTVDGMTMEVTPTDAPDAFGAWWVSLFNNKQLNSIRLSDAEYDRLTKPHTEVVDQRGRVKELGWTPEEVDLARPQADSEFLIRGFYRDDSGQFRLLKGS